AVRRPTCVLGRLAPPRAGARAALWAWRSAPGARRGAFIPLDRAYVAAPATILRGVILGPASVRVNGEPLAAGIRVLRERDEFCVGTARHFFSTEALAAVTPAPESATPPRCPRCTTTILADSPSVRCPQCTLLHHAACWSY